MNKRIKIFVSFLLIFALFVSSFCMPASSFENDIETSTADMLLINMDTDTVVFSQKPDNMWYAGTLAEMMTFLIAHEKIKEPDKVTFKVEESFINKLPYTDGCLDIYVGETLTATDLMTIMLLTSGSDAAYALADLASDGNVDTFIDEMNQRAAKLGMTKTGYVSPGYNDTSDHYTTCRDLYRLYQEIRKIDFFSSVMQLQAYTPKGMEEENHTVKVQASILNETSPYYFRYTNDAMYSYTEATYAGIALTTTYHGKTYFFAGLLGLHTSEQNVYADAKKLTSWAYTSLSDYRILNTDDVITDIAVKTGWGEYPVGLNPKSSAFTTLPNDYDKDKITYMYEIPDSVEAPIFAGQKVGTVNISYADEKVDELPLVVGEDEGVGMLHDISRFSSFAYRQLLVYSDLSSSYPSNEEKSEAASEESKPASTQSNEQQAEKATSAAAEG